jgi:hypothetical protein
MHAQNSVITIQIPLALESLIRSNNQLLKQYQEKLLQEINEASIDTMRLLNLEVDGSWQLDVSNMTFVRPKREGEYDDDDNISDIDYGTIS